MFPVLDHRREIRIDEEEGGSKVIKAHPTARFISTANIGIEYSSTRSIDRALQDRFMSFNIPYITGDELNDYIYSTEELTSVGKKRVAQMSKIYDYSHTLFGKGKIGTRISTRAVLDIVSLLQGDDFSVQQILDHAILSQYEQDSSTIVNDANVLREFADSIGIYTPSDNESLNG